MSAFLESTASRLFTTLYGPKYLIVTNAVTCGVLMAIGDVTVQKIERIARPEEGKKSIDWSRTGRLLIVGIVMGLCGHGWYTFLDIVLPTASPIVVGQKILLDQMLAAPFMAFGFFMGTNLLERVPLDKSWEEFRSKFWTVYKMDWLIWPAAQAVDFFFLAPQFRVLYVSFIAIFWDSFLSYIKHKSLDEDKKEEPKI